MAKARPSRSGRAKRAAVSFVLNYEEGGEMNVLHGDPASEIYLQEIAGATARKGARDLNVESMYEYGSRAGFWRVRRLFVERGVPLTVYAVGMALERNPEAGRAMAEAGWEVASHGYRWFDYQNIPKESSGPTRPSDPGDGADRTRPLPPQPNRPHHSTPTICPWEVLRSAAPHHPVYTRHQRFQIRPKRFQPRRGVLRLLPRRVRRALRGGEGCAEDDVDRSALPPRRPAWQGQGPRAPRRSHPAPRPRLALPARRDRPSLAAGPSLAGRVT